MSLTARHLEANGIATVIVGSAFDIVDYCEVPRYLHVDFPLGNPCGKPFDETSQCEIAEQALDLFATAKSANTTVRAPQVWSEDNSWRDAYAAVTEENRAQLFAKGEARRAAQSEAKAAGKSVLNKIE